MAQATSDKEQSESWLETLASAAARLGAGEALAELRSEARELLGEVRRAAAEVARDDAPSEDARPQAAAAAANISNAIVERMDALSASLEEVSDLLDAGLERLETVEMQLGDPDDSVDARLRSGIETCERRLGGIEHRLAEIARRGRPSPAPASRPRILVVDSECRRRCDLCVALEHEGMHTLAAPGPASALRMLQSHAPSAVLARADLGTVLEAMDEEWPQGASVPRLLLVPSPAPRQLVSDLSSRFPDWTSVSADHGIAALCEHIRALLVSATEPDSPALPGHEENRPDASL